MLYIFDLDATVIDSSHRQNTKPDGSLDLDKWRENSTPEMIERDSLLPLAKMMRAIYRKRRSGHKVAVCTARVMSKADWEYLQNRSLKFDYAMARAEGDDRPDAQLKFDKITNLLVGLKMPRKRWPISVTILDDNKSVLKMAKNELGIIAVDAVKFNRELQNAG